MELIKGKAELLNYLSTFIDERKTKRVFLHSVVDKEIIKLIADKQNGSEEKIDFRILISNLPKNYIFNNIRSFLNFCKVRTNVKCRSKFIILNEHVFFFSGSWSDTSHQIGENDLTIMFSTQSHSGVELEKMFMKDWKSGMELHLQ